LIKRHEYNITLPNLIKTSRKLPNIIADNFSQKESWWLIMPTYIQCVIKWLYHKKTHCHLLISPYLQFILFTAQLLLFYLSKVGIH